MSELVRQKGVKTKVYFLGQDDIEFRKRSKTWPSRRKPWKRPCGVFIGQEHVHPAQQLFKAVPFSGWVPIWEAPVVARYARVEGIYGNEKLDPYDDQKALKQYKDKY